jgi:P-type conjugative transfer protein TrbG
MRPRPTRSLFVLLWVSACAQQVAPAKAPAEFVQATPVAETSPSPVDAVNSATEATDATDAPEDWRPVAGPPAPDQAVRAPLGNPSSVIAEANERALQAPEQDGFVNAVMTYAFVPGGIYKVYAAPEHVTDLVLEPGEDLTGDPAAGDTLRWRLGVGTSAVNGVPQNHVFLKPTRPGLSTNLTLNTDRRTYFIQLESLETTSMFAVRWTYPHDEAAATSLPAAREHQPRPATADAADLHWDYAIQVTQGKPSWKPQIVFDDGRKTYIRFPRNIVFAESPALFVVHGGEMQIVNYRVKRNLYIVDRIFHVAELRLGQQDQDIVRLTRK